MHTVNPYDILMRHIEKHRYIRGMNKGDAPLDPKRRRRDWERVVQHPDRVTIRRYNTDIITVYPDGRVVLDFDGWESSPTTRVCATQALWLMGLRLSVGSVRYKNLSQVCVNLPSGTYKYYPGMELVQKDEKWVVIDPKQFMARVRNTELSHKFDEEVKSSGFKHLFPILHMNAQPEDRAYQPGIPDLITYAAFAEHWPGIVAYFKWEIGYDMRTMKRHWLEKDRAKTWTAIMNYCKKPMTKIVPTGITVL
jgi:hypothetical protein